MQPTAFFYTRTTLDLATICREESPRTRDSCPVLTIHDDTNPHMLVYLYALAHGKHVHGYRTTKYAFMATTFHKLLINAFPGSMSWSASQERPFPEVASAPRTSNHEADTPSGRRNLAARQRSRRVFLNGNRTIIVDRVYAGFVTFCICHYGQQPKTSLLKSLLFFFCLNLVKWLESSISQTMRN